MIDNKNINCSNLNKLSAVNYNSLVFKEYLKFNPKTEQKSLIRIYKKYEKINFKEREVFYIVGYLGTDPIIKEVIFIKRTLNLKELNRIIKHLEVLE